MSYNLVDPTTGDLTRVAGNSNIVDTAIEIDSTWSSKKINDSTLKTIQLSGSVDCNTLTELGLYTASAGAVSALTNAPINNQVHLDGGFSILVTKTNVDSIYYGMQMFIPYGSDAPFIRKAYYFNNRQYWTSWEQVATMDKVAQPIGFKTSLLNQCWGYYTKRGKTISVHMKFVLSSALSDWQPITNTKLPTPSSAITKSANEKTGATNSVYIYTDGAMSQAGGGGMPADTYEFDFDYTMA